MTTKIIGVVLIGLAALRASAHAQAPSSAMDLVTHNEVLIKATPAEIWPHIVEPNVWKTGAKLIAVDGEPGRLGALFKAVTPDDPEKILFHAENVEMVAERRRTIRLNALDGALIGFAIWQLTPQNASTWVKYRVYSQVVLPPQPAASPVPADLAAARTNYHNANHQRFAAELAALKQLVESHQ